MMVDGPKCLINAAGSDGRRNTCLKCTRRSLGAIEGGPRRQPVEGNAHADGAMNSPIGYADASVAKSVAPRCHMFIHAVDQSTVQIEQND